MGVSGSGRNEGQTEERGIKVTKEEKPGMWTEVASLTKVEKKIQKQRDLRTLSLRPWQHVSILNKAEGYKLHLNDCRTQNAT